jgi:nitrate reductase gamma subunit
MARLHWLEAMLPLGIIGGMLCIMGNAQYYIHRAAHGRVRSDPTPPDLTRPDSAPC